MSDTDAATNRASVIDGANKLYVECIRLELENKRLREDIRRLKLRENKS